MCKAHNGRNRIFIICVENFLFRSEPDLMVPSFEQQTLNCHKITTCGLIKKVLLTLCSLCFLVHFGVKKTTFS